MHCINNATNSAYNQNNTANKYKTIDFDVYKMNINGYFCFLI